MSVSTPEAEVVHETTSLSDLDFDIELPCEVPQRRAVGGGGTPHCGGAPARWVAWRVSCCPESPRYVLLCDYCKRSYQMWMLMGAAIYCADCSMETGGFVSFTELNRKA